MKIMDMIIAVLSICNMIVGHVDVVVNIHKVDPDKYNKTRPQ